MPSETIELERLVDDPEIRHAAAKTLKGFCLTYLPHHFPADLSDFFDEMAAALQDHDQRRLEIIGFRGCAKSTMASLALVLWAALEHPDRYPFIIMLADTRGQASINAASVQHELRNNELILRDYGHLKYKKIDDPRPEPTLESDEDWQAMNCVLDNGARILSRSRGQKVRGLKHRQHRPSLVIADDVEGLDWVRTQENRDKSDRWFSETMETLDNVRRSSNMSSEFFVEAVAYQQVAIEEMERRAFSVQAMHPIKDKRVRLRVAARYIKMGVVQFPRTGCEELITQLLGFGVEKHDDAVDALVYLILGVIQDGVEERVIHYV